jgi:hypothetical protein
MKNSIILIFGFILISCTSNKDKTTFLCENLKLTDSISFYKHKIDFEAFDSICDLKKVNGKIIIPNSNIFFKDNIDKEILEYKVLGENKNRNWFSIIAQDPMQNYYYLYNNKNNKLDTLIGEPKIFNNNILSIEEEYTDYPEIIQIWNIQNNGDIKKNKEFSIKYCRNWSISNSYINDNKVYLECGGNSSTKREYFYIELNKI